MDYCSTCGNPIDKEAKFCNSCGTAIGEKAKERFCPKCGHTYSLTDKFCPGCGTSTPPKQEIKQPQQDNAAKQEPKNKGEYTKEGRKIIDAGPRPEQHQSTSPPPPPSPISKPTKKKKRGCLGCLGKSLLIIFVLMIIGVVIIWNLPDDEGDKLTDTNIPGIVDIKPNEDNNPDRAESDATEKQTVKPGKENKDAKKTAKMVEDIFEKSDTLKLKKLLTEKSLETYAGVFDDIYPHMPDYAKAFKNRKLKISKNALSVYEFKDENGDTFYVTFEMQADGKWKLINF